MGYERVRKPLKIAVIGSRGQLGRSLVATLSQTDDVVVFDRPTCDITDPRSIRPIICARPDVVIHPAAYADVDGCERDPELAYQVNAQGTLHVVKACQESGATLVYISTNYVFDGTKEGPYTEDDQPHPISVYGRSKLVGEIYVQDALARHYVVRTGWLYSSRGRNFVKTMLSLSSERKEISVVDDQFGSPTYSRDLAQAIGELIRKPRYGLYHLTNQGSTSWYGWAQKILEYTERESVELLPIPGSEYKREATPPSNGVLANVRASEELGINLRPWEDALHDHLISIVARSS